MATKGGRKRWQLSVEPTREFLAEKVERYSVDEVALKCDISVRAIHRILYENQFVEIPLADAIFEAYGTSTRAYYPKEEYEWAIWLEPGWDNDL